MPKHDFVASEHTLSPGAILHDNYIINRVLGEGGFGITYSGTCIETKEQVAIKEFFPSGVATRTMHNGKSCVSHFEGKLADSFRRGMHRFLNEANLLKSFQYLSSIVSVFDVFEENNTAYIVMEYIEGITLKQLIENEGVLSFDEMITLFEPVLLDLHEVHKKGLIHRDISPDNLIVGMDNHLHLIDFGAASFENPNETKTMTVILKSGYAPPEQYISDGKIGAWTDVYGLCATMYMVLNGKKPIDSIRRMQRDTLDFIDGHSPLANHQKDVILQGLRLNYAERFSSTKRLYHALTTIPTEEITATMESTSISLKMKEQIKDFGNNDIISPRPPRRWRLLAFTCIALTLSYCTLGIFGANVPLWPKALTITSSNRNTPENVNTNNTTDSTTDNTTDDTAMPNDDTLVTNTNDVTSESALNDLTTSILTMIDVTGKTSEAAKSALSALDSSIEVTITEEYNSDVGLGLVISQSIAEDTQFTEGQITQIQLVVSKGPTPTTQAPKATTTTKSNTKTTQQSTESTKKSSKNTKKKDDGYSTIHLD